jgi:hypothetical protein
VTIINVGLAWRLGAVAAIAVVLVPVLNRLLLLRNPYYETPWCRAAAMHLPTFILMTVVHRTLPFGTRVRLTASPPENQ